MTIEIKSVKSVLLKDQLQEAKNLGLAWEDIKAARRVITTISQQLFDDPRFIQGIHDDIIGILDEQEAHAKERVVEQEQEPQTVEKAHSPRFNRRDLFIFGLGAGTTIALAADEIGRRRSPQLPPSQPISPRPEVAPKQQLTVAKEKQEKPEDPVTRVLREDKMTLDLEPTTTSFLGFRAFHPIRRTNFLPSGQVYEIVDVDPSTPNRIYTVLENGEIEFTTKQGYTLSTGIKLTGYTDSKNTARIMLNVQLTADRYNGPYDKRLLRDNFFSSWADGRVIAIENVSTGEINYFRITPGNSTPPSFAVTRKDRRLPS